MLRVLSYDGLDKDGFGFWLSSAFFLLFFAFLNGMNNAVNSLEAS